MGRKEVTADSIATIVVAMKGTKKGAHERLLGAVSQVALAVALRTSTYIERLGEGIDPTLTVSIKECVTRIRQHNRLLGLNAQSKLKYAEAIGKHRERLDESAIGVISQCVDSMQHD